LGLVLILVGATAIGGYGAYITAQEVVFAPDTPLALRLGIPALTIGSLAALAGAVWDRLRAKSSTDRAIEDAQP
jgi:hypothetical protein